MIIGSPITDFDEISSFDISSRYYLLVSERDMYVHDNFNSRRVDVDVVGNHSDVAVVEFIKRRFGDVAFMETSSFSPKDHTHNYSNITFRTYCDKSLSSADKMGVIFLDGRHYDIYYDKDKNCRDVPSLGDTILLCQNGYTDVSDWKCNGTYEIGDSIISSLTYVGGRK